MIIFIRVFNWAQQTVNIFAEEHGVKTENKSKIQAINNQQMLVIITSDHGKLQTYLFQNFLNLPETYTLIDDP